MFLLATYRYALRKHQCSQGVGGLLPVSGGPHLYVNSMARIVPDPLIPLCHSSKSWCPKGGFITDSVPQIP